MYEYFPSVREVLDDQTKHREANIHKGEQAWKTYTQLMMMMMHAGLLVMCLLFLPDFDQNRNL
jgi:hypothetical protein